MEKLLWSAGASKGILRHNALGQRILSQQAGRAEIPIFRLTARTRDWVLTLSHKIVMGSWLYFNRSSAASRPALPFSLSTKGQAEISLRGYLLF